MDTCNHQAARLDVVEGSPRLAIEAAGQGEVVLFLHGIGGNRSNWAGQLQAAAGDYRAVAWDMRGYGDSEDYPGPFSFEDVQRDLDRVLDHLGVQACHLVGLSLGGRIGYGYAHARPQRVLSLTACSAVPFSTDMTPQVRAAFLASRRAPLLSGKTPADIAPVVAAQLAGPRCPAPARQALVASLSALHADSYLKTLEAVSAPAHRYPLAEIRVPVHIIAAGCDTLFPKQTLRRIAQAIPGACCTEIADAGHLSNLEYPETFNAAMLDFLRKLRHGD